MDFDMVMLFVHFFAAWLVTFVLASLFHTQFVLYELTRLGVQIDLATRVETSANDLLGLLPGYGGILAVALLLGFLCMAGVRRWRPGVGYWVYPLAGLLALLTAHLAMHPIFNVTLIAGARSDMGLLAQCLAGLAGGVAFAYERRKKRS